MTGLARLALPVGALCACAVIDPRQPAGWIFCPFRLVTGWPCPLCGMTRGLSSLLHGRWREGVDFHLFSPLVLAGFAVWMVVETGHAMGLWNAEPMERWALRPGPWLALFLLCVAYGALRWCGIIGTPVT